MPIPLLYLVVILIAIILLGLLSAEKLIKITFASYVMLAISLALGTMLITYSWALNINPELTFLGIRYGAYANFLTNAQPTIILVLSGLLLWFFAQNSHLQISFSMISWKLQALVWLPLCIGSLISYLFFTLSYFKGGIYEWLFMNPEIVTYTQYLPLFCCVVGLLVIICSSHINIKLTISKDEPTL